MRRGYFEEADGGTLFLDEIGELPLPSQAKLLRVLQSGEFIRVGSSKVLKTDVRLVAATNVNLINAVSKGKFREDLYYRLNAVSIKMPSLRERPADINLLFRKFSSDFSARYGTGRVSLSEDAEIMLRKYRWPGNIRQLKNIAETVSVLESSRTGNDRRVIDADTLSQYIPKDEQNLLPAKSSPWQEDNSAEREAIIRTIIQLKQDVEYLKEVISKAGLSASAHPVATQAIQGPAALDSHDNITPGNRWGMPDVDMEDPEEQELESNDPEEMSIHNANMELIEKALRKHGGNRKAAATELGISERTLYRKIKQMSEK